MVQCQGTGRLSYQFQIRHLLAIAVLSSAFINSMWVPHRASTTSGDTIFIMTVPQCNFCNGNPSQSSNPKQNLKILTSTCLHNQSSTSFVSVDFSFRRGSFMYTMSPFLTRLFVRCRLAPLESHTDRMPRCRLTKRHRCMTSSAERVLRVILVKPDQEALLVDVASEEEPDVKEKRELVDRLPPIDPLPSVRRPSSEPSRSSRW